MMTGRRVRLEEETATMERRTREKRGKGVAKEELTEEVYVLQEDSEEDMGMYDSDEAEGVLTIWRSKLQLFYI